MKPESTKVKKPGHLKVKGIPFEFSDCTLVIPPLSLGALEQLQPRLSGMDENISSPEYTSTVIDAVHSALKRNYPEMTRGEVAPCSIFRTCRR